MEENSVVEREQGLRKNELSQASRIQTTLKLSENESPLCCFENSVFKEQNHPKIVYKFGGKYDQKKFFLKKTRVGDSIMKKSKKLRKIIKNNTPGFFYEQNNLKNSKIIIQSVDGVPLWISETQNKIPDRLNFYTLLSFASRQIYLTNMILTGKDLGKVIVSSCTVEELVLHNCCLLCNSFPKMPDKTSEISKITLNHCSNLNGEDWYQETPFIQNLLKFFISEISPPKRGLKSGLCKRSSGTMPSSRNKNLGNLLEDSNGSSSPTKTQCFYNRYLNKLEIIEIVNFPKIPESLFEDLLRGSEWRMIRSPQKIGKDKIFIRKCDAYSNQAQTKSEFDGNGNFKLRTKQRISHAAKQERECCNCNIQ
ncbi:unnamed protein product [Moneuplotes crassus]|uniref:Uncharacterized protein n=1 Tax=Euplotes crassus TaxID=5936 RepID=A0AAD1UQ71_EUPCR|nr:unnamed protein product [Moneuplotes crassus]